MTNPMIQKSAQTTNIASHPAFWGRDPFREHQWKLSNSLQTTLEVDRLIALFSQALQETVEHQGYRYRNDREDILICSGVRAHFSCCYRLFVDHEDLGELRLTRRSRFTESESKKVENLITCLVYPLRNALLYNRALRCAHTDSLTGVNNRVGMEECIRRESELAKRQNTPLSLMLIDIDHFKSFNDRYGHACGDQVLKTVARTIRDTIRASDVIFRYGGEEFVVVLSNTDITGAAQLAERIRLAIQNMRLTNEFRSMRITASLGLSSLKPDASIHDLLMKADRAMYQAKRNGRNRVVELP